VSSPIRLISPPCLLAAIALFAAAPGGSAAASLKSCSIRGKEQKLGATYVTTLKVRGVSCATGQRVVKAFQSCRRAKGVKGYCTRKVLKYGCSEQRPADETIPTQFTGHVTCRRASRHVAFVYQQNT
jgi:uncharacterized cupredoxin-like copper-binding protein